MHCPRCEADTPEGAKFCIECGTPLQPRCPQCGADTLPRAKCCPACGTLLTALTPAPSAASPPSPLCYTPGYLAETILSTKTALEGERKQVTVLVADLKGSMELLAEGLGMRPLRAHYHRGLGTPYVKTGRWEQARTELSTAITLYHAMDMTYWLPQAEVALAQLEER